MAVNLPLILVRMEHNLHAIRALASGVDDAQARWRPAPEEWSVLEVVNHLYDEEREDFRRRLELTLQDPRQEWPPNDPQAWVTERSYNTRDLAKSVAAFEAERRQSIGWLKALKSPNWDNRKHHPAGFHLSAADLLVSWAAHDSLHLRQLAELHHQYITAISAPASTGYAGDF